MMTTRVTPALVLLLLLTALPTADAAPPPVGPVPALVAGRPTTQAMEVRVQQLHVRIAAAERELTDYRKYVVSCLAERERAKPHERAEIDCQLRIFERFEASAAKQLGELRGDAQRLRDVIITRSQR